MKRYLVLILALVLVVSLFAGCSTQQPSEQDTTNEQPTESSEEQNTENKESTENTDTTKKEKVLRWNVGAEPKTIDPQLNSASDGGHVINNTFEGLMREIDGKLQPAMAERYEVSEDGLKYTFYLRDAKWSDGKPVTAHDFEYAWKRAMNPDTASEYGYIVYSYIKGGEDFYSGKISEDEVGVKALDDKTLEVTLAGPTPYFLDLTTFYTYMPVRRDVVEKDPEGWAKNPDLAVSNGPFKLVEYATGDKLVLAKNENYWQADKVKLDKIVASMIVEESTILTAYESDELDVIDAVPRQEIPTLLVEEPTFQIKPILGTYFYVFNVTKPPVDDPRVRRALSLAIDRKSICENVSKGGEIPATGYVPPGLTDSQGNDFRKTAGDYGIDPNAANVEEAKKLLAEAGYPDGKGFPKIELLYNTLEAHKAIAEAIQEMWKKNLGIEVTLSNQEWAVFQETRKNGNFTLARHGWLGDYNDAMTFLDMWIENSGHNDAQWRGFPESKKYSELIEQSKTTTGVERDKLLYEAEKILMENAIVMPIYYYTDPQAVKERVKNWQKTILGHWFFGYVDIVE